MYKSVYFLPANKLFQPITSFVALATLIINTNIGKKINIIHNSYQSINGFKATFLSRTHLSAYQKFQNQRNIYKTLFSQSEAVNLTFCLQNTYQPISSFKPNILSTKNPSVNQQVRMSEEVWMVPHI